MKPLVYAPNRKIHAAAAATRNWPKVGPSGFRFLVFTAVVTRILNRLGPSRLEFLVTTAVVTRNSSRLGPRQFTHQITAAALIRNKRGRVRVHTLECRERV